MVRVYLIADENEMCPLSLSLRKREQMHVKRATFKAFRHHFICIFCLLLLCFRIFRIFRLFLHICADANAKMLRCKEVEYYP